jgi:hypothetical protein
MLDDGIDDAFKFSPDPNLTVLNPSMKVVKIIDQLMTTYSRLTPIALPHIDTLFCSSVYSPLNAPEMSYCQIEDCQEIQMLGDDPYTPMQLLNNAIRLLLGYSHYHCNFKEWDSKDAADKIWINLKPFIKEAYQCRLNAMSNTAGQHGYMQNAFAILKESDDDDNDVATVMTQMAALTMQSQLSAASSAAMSSSVTLAINQLAANQQATMQQMMAYTNTAQNPPPATLAPISQFTILAIGNFAPGGTAHGGRWVERGQGGHAAGCGLGGQRNLCTPFANYAACTG